MSDLRYTYKRVATVNPEIMYTYARSEMRQGYTYSRQSRMPERVAYSYKRGADVVAHIYKRD